MYRVELSKRALRDLRRIDHKSRKRLLDLLEGDLATEPQPANLDIKPLTGRAPLLNGSPGTGKTMQGLGRRGRARPPGSASAIGR